MRDDEVLSVSFIAEAEVPCAGDCGESVTVPSLLPIEGDRHPALIWWHQESYSSDVERSRRQFSEGTLFTLHHDTEDGVVTVPYCLIPTERSAREPLHRLPKFGIGADRVIWVCRSCVRAGFAINSEMQGRVRAEMEQPRAFPSLGEFRKAV